jgi:hypothetical protein
MLLYLTHNMFDDLNRKKNKCESGGMVYALVLGTSTERFKSSSLFSRTIYSKEITMRQATFENIYNKERFVMTGKPEKKFIDGVEFVKLLVPGTQRSVFVRRDFLKKVNT